MAKLTGIQRMDYFELMERRLQGGESGVPESLNSKESTRAFADFIGIRTAKLLFQGTLSQLEKFRFNEDSVVKPSYASTSLGVHLVGIHNGSMINLVTGEPLPEEELWGRLAEVERRYFNDVGEGTYLVEQLLRDRDGGTPPADIRFYMFQGECAFIMIEDHITGLAAVSYFNGDFSPMDDVDQRFGIADPVKHLESIVHDAPPPLHAADLLAVARRVSVAVPSAFCRVDLYDTSEGPVLGEITLFPGTFYYKNRKLMAPHEARRLGAMWHEAEKRLAGSRILAPSNRPPLRL